MGMIARTFFAFCLALLVSGRGIDPLLVLYNISFSWDGAGPSCNTCNDASAGYFQLEDYACNSNGTFSFTTGFSTGFWNDGLQSFSDPHVADGSTYMLTQVTVSLVGAFDCDTVVNATTGTQLDTPVFEAYLQDVLIYRYEAAGSSAICLCPSCGTEIVLPPAFQVQGWPNFNYGGHNWFQIVVHQGVVCVANATLMLAYSEGTPALTHARTHNTRTQTRACAHTQTKEAHDSHMSTMVAPQERVLSTPLNPRLARSLM
eukprot:TRINITY_DN5304_c0_g1_i1.p1 TRINITY_DN5304_c0_g1~~TRINITY_DN5304_c0_g1_i1.p1  ORF type:complete len:259 (-),score=28.24 TRINITY_DN5304_c0_g1_i1:38-814(-)